MNQPNDTAVRWPTSSDYSQAVQSPDVSLVGESLRGLEPVYGPMGVPLSASGQNAIVFLLAAPSGEQFALRCFTTPATTARPRYEALHDYVGDRHREWLASSEWVPAGVQATGRTWPAVLMPWVAGRPMNVAVADALEDGPEHLDPFIDGWASVVANLEASGIAHGDLQHGNVLVTDEGSMKLVDLDGVWIPQVGLTPPNEIGHPNYQHPQRSVDHWGRYVDSFSALVIDVGLRALRADPSLLDLSGGENLLLSRPDLVHPDRSQVFGRLRTSRDPEVVGRAERLEELCRAPIHHSIVPFDRLLDRDSSAVGSRFAAPRSPAGTLATPPVPTPVANEGNWWETGDAGVSSTLPSATASSPAPVSAAAPSARTTGPPGVSPPPAVRPAHSTQQVGAPEPAAARGGGVGLRSSTAGAIGGLFAGLVSILVYAGFRDAVTFNVQAGLFVMIVAPVIGFFVLGVQPALVGQIPKSLGRGALGALASATAALLGIAIADPVFSAIVRDRPISDSTPVLTSALVWSIVAGLIGLALGLLQSMRAMLIGFTVGAFAGFVGGLVFGATTDIVGTTLVIEASLATTAATAFVGALIGFAVGGARKAGASAVARVIEGPSSGLEVLMRQQVVIGNTGSADIRISDPAVHAKHATLKRQDGRLVVVAHQPIEIDGGIRPTGEHPVASGSVLRIGPAFIQVTGRSDGEE